ncbi:T-cell-interacting, activating receptor on myeloid cells protein 1-like isoform X3 [Ambystoma mexicanum]|uniref:T-cell-interacting, activating receptor on myeloid cells protein 1-like isoform X3 n=1 Tax=Ambystoma mexicanum TaxID=8296 RepID=UPI0037E8AF4F
MPSAFVTCLIFSCYFLDMWNWVSFGQGSYPKATLEVSPGNVTARGGNLTFRCVGLYPSMQFILYRGSDVLKTLDPPGSEATFLLTDLQPADKGAYTCRYLPRTGPTIYSDASDIIQIKVLDLAKPCISWAAVKGVKGDYKINCSAPEDQKVKSFFLYEGSVTQKTDRKPPPKEHQVTFPISGVSDSTSMEYRCSYQVKESGRLVASPLSDPVDFRKGSKHCTTPGSRARTVTGSSQPITGKGAQMDSDEDEEQNKPDEPAKNNYISLTTIIISVVCSVLLVIALIAVIIVYIKHKTNKAGSDSQKSSLSKGAEEIERAAETMYASVGRGEQRDTAITTEGACQEEYLTYAVINKDALKKHKWAPSSEPAEATVYASVNVQ